MVRLPYRDRSGTQQGYIYVQEKRRLAHEYKIEVEESDLLNRGWVFQERFLSRRIACFTSTSLIFECRANLAENVLGESIRETDDVTTLKPRYGLEDADLSMTQWYQSVELYSSLNLTYPTKDRLKALSGFRQGFERASKTYKRNGRATVQNPAMAYYGGIWLSNAATGLLWMSVCPAERHIALPFPSWSWASFPGQVTWNLGTHCIRDASAAHKFQVRAAVPDDIDTDEADYLQIKSCMQSVFLDRVLSKVEVELLYGRAYRPRSLDNRYRAIRARSKNGMNRLSGWAALDYEMDPRNYQSATREMLLDHETSANNGRVDRGSAANDSIETVQQIFRPPEVPDSTNAILSRVEGDAARKPDQNLPYQGNASLSKYERFFCHISDVEGLDVPYDKHGVHYQDLGRPIDKLASVDTTSPETLIPAPSSAGIPLHNTPIHPPGSDYEDGSDIMAMMISTAKEMNDGCSYGYWVPWHTLFNVLFVQMISPGTFKRIGMGVLFGPHVARGFQRAEFEDIKLV